MENEIYAEQPFAPVISKGFSLLILNGSKINKQNLLLYSTFQKLWTQSSYRHAADGGLNVLYELDKESPSVFIPHCVSGDFDSVSKELIDEYQAYGVDIQETPDQNSTDFEKALRMILERVPEDPVFVIGTGAKGRLDHQMSQIHTMVKISNEFQSPVYFLRDTSLMRVLKKGAHRLALNTGYEGKIGLIPVDGECNVRTTGLKWNIDGPMRVGELISSSNEKVSDEIEIITDGSLLFTVEMVEPPSVCCKSKVFDI
ncbi:Oidioi.mRNA.OKI2018_I69.chr1.g3033.t1.cds [Oikopleura dioica]|uniref:Oidioi.mRNA.OKI2018_I69.chr1.g3033.t1.cds n=1 Tax=Oikopleura dioica TaxID=34765 RepID=A0ABN7T237_OIKDI|nr:Oidioi.mRNA.OKI2018_I69.chr1.g3033.t1.cds [Oikopleura dioica]